MEYKALMIRNPVTNELETVYVMKEPVAALLAGRTNKILLEYNGANIIMPDDSVATFDGIYDALMVSPDFVVLVYNNRAYHPNQVSTEQIVFSATYPSNGYIKSERITLLASGAVTTTFGEAEKTSSRVSAIADADKDDENKYPSVKAVVDYVDGLLSGVEESAYALAESAAALNEVI